MATFNKFDAFVQAIGRKLHNLNADTLKVVLSNTAPVAGNAVLADITQIASGNGYTTGGNSAGAGAYSQTSGTAKLTATDVVFTAAGGSFATFRYAVLYNDTASNDELIGWWDYGSAVTLTDGNTFTVDFDGTNGILTLQ